MTALRPRFGSALPIVAGATSGSVAAALAWSCLYGLGGAGFSVLAAAHAGLGLVLAGCLAVAGLRGRWSFAAGLAASLALAGLVPAILGRISEPGSTIPAAGELAGVAQRDPLAQRIAIIGLDGADWSVIDPLVAAGELPNLASLVSRGRGAVLRSIEPIHSPVVWTSIFSGRPPREHGIESWRSSHAANRRTGVLWEMADAAGLASLVVNVPGTWPPTEVEGGLVSGFPMPSPLRRGGADPRLAQSVATVVDGCAHAEASLGGALAPSRNWRHFAIDAAITRGWLPIPQVQIDLRRVGECDSGPAVWSVDDQRIELARGAWSPWLAMSGPGGPLHARIRRLDDGALFLTPAFQDPRAPIHPYTSSPALQDLVAGLGMYVVEPTGWKSVADPSTRDALFEHLVDVEEMHLRASLALRSWRPDWSVFAHVITLPDRASHAFWRFHEPEDYPPIPAAELAAHRDNVARAYRESDRLLGELIAGLGSETTVIVLSDHGFQSEGDAWGGHRLEGMLVAAGPGIAAGSDRLALSIYEVAPLALTLLGLPVADDLAGDAPAALLTPGAPMRHIASYEIRAASRVPRTMIEETTEEQLRGLGYLE